MSALDSILRLWDDDSAGLTLGYYARVELAKLRAAALEGSGNAPLGSEERELMLRLADYCERWILNGKFSDTPADKFALAQDINKVRAWLSAYPAPDD